MGLDAHGRVLTDDFVWERCNTCGQAANITPHLAHTQGAPVTGAHQFTPSGVHRKPGDDRWTVLEFVAARGWTQ